MGLFLQQHRFAALLSTAFHVVLAVALTVGLNPSGGRRAALPIEQMALEATVVDESLIQRELERLEQLDQAEVLRQQQAERQAREQAEAARRQLEEEQQRLEAARQERNEEARQEQLRLSELQRQRDEAERARIEEEARLERLRQEEEQRLAREREAEAERQRQEAAAARQRAEMEAELQLALALEDERRQAEEAGLLDEYIRLIENRIQQNWISPVSSHVGLECVVNVTQIPSGDVVDVRVGRCNGDEAVVRSIEAAVLRSSPLPRPPISSLFERNLEVVFNPEG
jgi:colicin import membrane protein